MEWQLIQKTKQYHLKDTELYNYNYSISNGKIVLFQLHCILLYDALQVRHAINEHWLL